MFIKKMSEQQDDIFALTYESSENDKDYLKYKSSTPKDAIAKTESRSLVHFSEEQLVQHKDTSTEDHSQESTNINGANLDDDLICKETDSHIGSDLINAAQSGNTERVNTILSRESVNPDKKKRYTERGALHLACGYGQTSVIKELLEANANPLEPNHLGRTPLHDACQGGHIEVLRLLLDYTTDCDIPDKQHQTPVHVAAFNGEVECLEMLQQRGAQLTIEDTEGRLPVHLSAMRNHVECITFFYKNGVDLQTACKQGRLPIHHAACYGALKSLVCLVERDCDVTIGDRSNALPIHLAASQNKRECVKFLVQQGASLQATQKDGKTALHLASQKGATKTLHWMLDQGLNPNITDNFFNTPLHYAALGGHAESFNCLLQHDGDMMLKNAKDDTALESAKKAGHPLLMQKAINNEVACSQCMTHSRKVQYERLHPTPSVVRCVTSLSTRAYHSPMPRQKQPLSAAVTPHSTLVSPLRSLYRSSKEPSERKQSRDLTTRFYGQFINNGGQ